MSGNRTPILSEDGFVKNTMLYVDGSRTSYRCECGANIFHQPDDKEPERYKCNSCGAEYVAEKE